MRGSWWLSCFTTFTRTGLAQKQRSRSGQSGYGGGPGRRGTDRSGSCRHHPGAYACASRLGQKGPGHYARGCPARPAGVGPQGGARSRIPPGARSPGPHMGSELSARGGQTLLGNGALGSAHPRTVWAVPVVPISFRTCRRSSIVLLLSHSQGTPCSTTSMLDRARAYHGVSGAINRNFLGSCR